MERMKHYTYYRSQASFRVRIAMNMKGLAHEDTYLHLEKGDQFDPGYKAVNPQMVVPTLVPRIRHYLTDDLKLPQEAMVGWIQHWLGAGLQAMETLLAEHKETGKYCHGDTPTLADIGLVTQVTPAKTFNTELGPYPRVMRIYETCMAIPAFADAAPAQQPDAE